MARLAILPNVERLWNSFSIFLPCFLTNSQQYLVLLLNPNPKYLKKFLILFFCIFSLKAFAQDPALKIKQIDGKIFDLKEQKGKVVLVSFWAKWCPNCRREMPLVDRFYKENSNKKFEVISINLDGRKHFVEVSQIAQQFSFKNSFFEDVIKTDFSEPNAIPTNYLIGRNGEFLGEIFFDEQGKSEKLLAILSK